MEQLRKIMKRLFFLPPWLTVLIAVPSYLFVFVMLGTGNDSSALSYLSYTLSAYALVITVTGAAKLVRAVQNGIAGLPPVKKIRSTSWGASFLDDPVFRAEASLYMGLFVNLAYAAVKLAAGIYYRSLWFISLSAYYVFLSGMRFLLLHHVRRSPAGQKYGSELRRYRLCGGMLLALNLALSVIVTLVVVWNQGFEYAGYLIYVMAMYAFYALITSAVNVVRFRRYNSPVLSAAKAINLTAALVSMLSLETAMIARFDTAKDPVFRRTTTALTGFAVCIFVLSMAIYMIVMANRELKKERMNEWKANSIQEVTDRG